MTANDTADVVKRIVGTWPMSPKGFLWTETLCDLDYGPALATFTKLRDEVEEQRISIARFLVTYRGIVSRGSTKRLDDDTPTCPTCEGSGMVSARQQIGADAYDVVVGCTGCAAGRVAAKTLAGVDRYNAAHSSAERRSAGPVLGIW